MPRIAIQQAALPFLLSVTYLIFEGYGGTLFDEETFIGLLIILPTTYWFISPFVFGRDMPIPTTASTLKASEHSFFRLVFFVIGVLVVFLVFWSTAMDGR